MPACLHDGAVSKGVLISYYEMLFYVRATSKNNDINNGGEVELCLRNFLIHNQFKST